MDAGNSFPKAVNDQDQQHQSPQKDPESAFVDVHGRKGHIVINKGQKNNDQPCQKFLFHKFYTTPFYTVFFSVLFHCNTTLPGCHYISLSDRKEPPHDCAGSLLSEISAFYLKIFHKQSTNGI